MTDWHRNGVRSIDEDGVHWEARWKLHNPQAVEVKDGYPNGNVASAPGRSGGGWSSGVGRGCGPSAEPQQSAAQADLCRGDQQTEVRAGNSDLRAAGWSCAFLFRIQSTRRGSAALFWRWRALCLVRQG